jgi:hypothetical protein
MTTSGVTAFDLTARDIVTTALEENGIIRLGRDPKAAELDACIRRLNGMLKSWSLRANLWREDSAEYTIPGGTGSIALEDDVQEVINVRFLQSATNSRPLYRWEQEQYRSLPNRASVGNPTAYAIERTIAGLTLKVWPVPADDIDVEVDYIRAAEIITNAGQTVDFRAEFQEAIYSNLAVRCAGIFGVEPSAELVARARELEGLVLDYDRPSSYFLESDCY